jgi:hypothetical protein
MRSVGFGALASSARIQQRSGYDGSSPPCPRFSPHIRTEYGAEEKRKGRRARRVSAKLFDDAQVFITEKRKGRRARRVSRALPTAAEYARRRQAQRSLRSA